MQCSYCNHFVDEKCLKRAEKSIKCKQVLDGDHGVVTDANGNEQQKFKRHWHHCWVKGNLKLDNR